MRKAQLPPSSSSQAGVAKAKSKEPKTPVSGPAPQLLTIADLSPSEKLKVSRLVHKLVTLGQEHEQALASLADEKALHAAEVDRLTEAHMTSIEEKLDEKDRIIVDLETKHALAMGLLALYQAKLKNSSEMFRYYELTDNENNIRINQLESDVTSLQSLVSSQKLTIESFESMSARYNDSLTKVQESHQQAVRRLQEDLAGSSGEIRKRDQRVASLQAQIEQLQADLLNKDDALARTHDQLSQLNLLNKTLSEQAAQAERKALTAPAPVGPDSSIYVGSQAIQTQKPLSSTSIDSMGSAVLSTISKKPPVVAVPPPRTVIQQDLPDMRCADVAKSSEDPYAAMYGSVESSFNMSFGSAYRIDVDGEGLGLDQSHSSSISRSRSHSRGYSQLMESVEGSGAGSAAEGEGEDEVEEYADQAEQAEVAEVAEEVAMLDALDLSTASAQLQPDGGINTQYNNYTQPVTAMSGQSVTTATPTFTKVSASGGGGESRRTLLDPTPMKPRQRTQGQVQLQGQVTPAPPSDQQSQSPYQHAHSVSGSASTPVHVPASAVPVVVTLPAPKQSSAEPVEPFSLNRRRLPARHAPDALRQRNPSQAHSQSHSQGQGLMDTSMPADWTLSGDESRPGTHPAAGYTSTASPMRDALNQSMNSNATADSADPVQQLLSSTQSGTKKKKKQKDVTTRAEVVNENTKEIPKEATKPRTKVHKLAAGKDEARPSSAESSRHRTFDTPPAIATTAAHNKAKVSVMSAGAVPSTPTTAGTSAATSRYMGTSPSAAEAVLAQVHSLPQLTSPPPAYTIARPDSARKREEPAEPATGGKKKAIPVPVASANASKTARLPPSKALPASGGAKSGTKTGAVVPVKDVRVPGSQPRKDSDRQGSGAGVLTSKVISYDDSLFNLLDEMDI